MGSRLPAAPLELRDRFAAWLKRTSGPIAETLLAVAAAGHARDLRERLLDEIKLAKVEVSASLVKADLKADIDVPGAKLVGGTYLVRK
jgi:hypothetical protein